MVTIEESDDERSIVTPDLRLRFRRVGDRWTHSIDIRPGPWQTFADAIEWSPEDQDGPARPTYQELHFQKNSEEAFALLVGQAGPHHFSASFRVRFRSYRHEGSSDQSNMSDHSESQIEIDVADRCRVEGLLETHYILHEPPNCTYLCDADEYDTPLGFLPLPRQALVWEARAKSNYALTLSAMDGVRASTVSIVGQSESGEWHVIARPDTPASSSTRRFGYVWAHRRVKSIARTSENEIMPWSLEGSPPPHNL